jgi:peroxiredoxin
MRKSGLALVAAFAIAGVANPSLARPPLKVGQVAPDYTVVTFDGRKFTSEELKGKVVVLNYWATWCAPCRVEMPVFNDYLVQRPGTDLHIFAVATEDSVPPQKLKPLASILSFPLIRKLWGKEYSLIGGSVPTTYVIDRAGVIRHAEAGAFNARSFDALVTPLLAEKAPVGQ